MKNILAAIGVLFLVFFVFVGVIQAAAATTTVGDLQVTVERPMFSESVIWYPGFTVTKLLTIKNIGGTTHTPFIQAINTSQSLGMADILGIQIFENTIERFGDGGSKHMSDFWSTGTMTFASLASGTSTEIHMTVAMPQSADNRYQRARATFDMNIGFVGTEDLVTEGNPTPEVLGEATASGIHFSCCWILIILILLLILYFFYKRFRKHTSVQAGTNDIL